MSASKVLFGTMIGFATGAVLGVLFAPDKGSMTRKKISTQGSQYLDAIKDTAGEYVDAIEERVAGVEEKAVEMAGRIKVAVNSLAGSEPQKRSHRS